MREIPKCPTHPTIFRIIPHIVAMQPPSYNANYLPSFRCVGRGLWGSPQVVDLIHHRDWITSFNLFLGISASYVQRLAASSWCMCASAVPSLPVASSNSFLQTALLCKSGEYQLLLFWYCIKILPSLHFLFSDARQPQVFTGSSGGSTCPQTS